MRAADAAAEFGDELDALGLAAAERGAGLAELEVAEAGVGEQLQWSGDAWLAGEELGSLGDAHAQHFADVPAVEVDLERGAVEAQALADFAGHARRGQEVHLHFDLAIAPQASQRPPSVLKEKRPAS
jgi:hypothetical protein